MAQMRRLTVAVQLAVLVLVAFVVTPTCKGFEKAEDTEISNVLAKRKSTPYTINVEGVLYCRCNMTGYLKAVDAAPLPGAVAVVKCNTTGTNVFISKTDAKGYFLVKATLANKYVARYCKVFVASPVPQCTVPRKYRFVGGSGAKITYEKNLIEGKTIVSLYTAGFLLLGPSNSSLCHL